MEDNKYKKEIKRFKHDVNQIKLSMQERMSMKSEILKEIGLSEQAKPSPFVIPSFYNARMFKFATVSFSMMLLIGAPFVFAYAEESLPGDILYPVKTNISEPVASLLKSEKEKEQYYVEISKKRIEELLKLKETNRIDSEKALVVRENLDKYAEKIFAEDSEVGEEKEEEDLVQVVENGGQFLENVREYSEIVDSIEGKTEEDDLFLDEVLDNVSEDIDALDEKSEKDAVDIVFTHYNKDSEDNRSEVSADVSRCVDIRDGLSDSMKDTIEAIRSGSDDIEDSEQERKDIIKSLLIGKSEIESIKDCVSNLESLDVLEHKPTQPAEIEVEDTVEDILE